MSDDCFSDVDQSDSIPPLPPPIQPKKRVSRLSDDYFSNVDQSDSIPPLPPPTKPKKRVSRLSDDYFIDVDQSDSIPPLPPPIQPKKRVSRLSDDYFSDVDQSDSIPLLPPPIIINKENSFTQTPFNSSFICSHLSETSMHDFASSTLMCNGGFFPDFFPNGASIPSPILILADATIRQISSHLPNSSSKHISCKYISQVKRPMTFAAQKDAKRRQRYIQNLGKSNKPEGTSFPIIVSVSYFFFLITSISTSTIVKLINTTKSLTELHLDHTSLKDDDMKIICTELANNTTIQRLVLTPQNKENFDIFSNHQFIKDRLRFWS